MRLRLAAFVLSVLALSSESLAQDEERGLRPMPPAIGFGLRSVMNSADDRPSPDAVMRSVEASRSKFIEAYDPPHHLKLLKVKLEAARKTLESLRAEAAAQPREKLVLEATSGVSNLERQIAATEKRQNERFECTPDVDDLNPLFPLDMSRPKVGMVGFVGPKSFGNQSNGAVRCLMTLGPDRFVGRYEEHYSLKMGGTHMVRSRPFIFVGVSPDEDGKEIVAGGLHRVKFNGVVAGEDFYPGANGESVAYVIERFDPDLPFQ